MILSESNRLVFELASGEQITQRAQEGDTDDEVHDEVKEVFYAVYAKK